MCVLVFSVVCLFVFEERERGRAGEVTAIDLFSGFDTSEAVSVAFSHFKCFRWTYSDTVVPEGDMNSLAFYLLFWHLADTLIQRSSQRR